MTGRSLLTWPRAVTVLLVAGLGAALYLVEWVEIERDDGYALEALRNPYLAATRFTEGLGGRVARVSGLQVLDDLPSTDDVILFASSRRALSDRRTEDLLDWVARGGSLILLATAYWDVERGASEDPLLDRLGIRLLRVDADVEAGDAGRLLAELGELAVQQIDANALCGPEQSLVRLEFESSGDGPLVAAFTSDRYLAYDGGFDGWAANDSGRQFAQRSVGSGWVTVLTSLRLWRNRVIGCHDHAHLLRRLVGDGRSVWWLYSAEMPPLWRVVWDARPTLVIALAVVLLLWLWREAYRLAPPRAAAPAERRAVLEHVVGVARFLWQQRRGDALLAALRQEVLAARRGEPLDKWLGEIGGRCPYDADTVREALQAPVGSDADRFVRAVRVLQAVKRTL